MLRLKFDERLTREYKALAVKILTNMVYLTAATAICVYTPDEWIMKELRFLTFGGLFILRFGMTLSLCHEIEGLREKGGVWEEKCLKSKDA